MEEAHQRTQRIMIVDDESGIRRVLTDLLEDEGYRVVAVRNGSEALNHLHTNVDLPCLILLDMLMPEVSGVEFLSRLHAEAGLAHIPVVAMSGNLYLAQMSDALGAADYLPKPFDVEEVLSMVTRICA